jgi:hypothetical protein
MSLMGTYISEDGCLSNLTMYLEGLVTCLNTLVSINDSTWHLVVLYNESLITSCWTLI